MSPNATVPAAFTVLAVAVLVFFALSNFSEKRLVSPPTPSVQTKTERTVITAPRIDVANPTLGATDADVTVIIYGDYACGPCGELEPAVRQVLGEFPDRIRLVWKDYPNVSAHPDAYVAAEAARCAQLQDAFWPMHDRLFANQDSLNTSSLPILAEGLPLDIAALKTCLADRTAKPRVDRDMEEGQALRIDATPTVFVNDRRFTGALTAETLRAAVTAFLPPR